MAYLRFEEPRWLSNTTCSAQERMVLFRDASAVRIVPGRHFRVPIEVVRMQEGWNRLAVVALGPHHTTWSTAVEDDGLLTTRDKLKVAADVAVEMVVPDAEASVMHFAQNPDGAVAAARLAVMRALQVVLAGQDWQAVDKTSLAPAAVARANEDLAAAGLAVLQVRSMVITGLRAQSAVIESAPESLLEDEIRAKQAARRRAEEIAQVRSVADQGRVVATASRDSRREDLNMLLDAIQRPGGEVLLAPGLATERLRLEAEVTKFLAAEREKWYQHMLQVIEVIAQNMGAQMEVEVLREALSKTWRVDNTWRVDST
jgi:hypothetical protein